MTEIKIFCYIPSLSISRRRLGETSLDGSDIFTEESSGIWWRGDVGPLGVRDAIVYRLANCGSRLDFDSGAENFADLACVFEAEKAVYILLAASNLIGGGGRGGAGSRIWGRVRL